MEEELIIKHNDREKFVIDFLTKIASETNIINLKGENGNDRIPLRIQMIIIFSLLDVFATFWCEYKDNQKTTHGKKCRDWYDQFCKTDKNEEFVNDKQWTLVNSSQIYNLRNSIVHFFALPEESENLSISLAPNNLPAVEAQNLCDLYNKIKKIGKDAIIIKPYNFHKLIRNGGMLMLEEFAKDIKISENDNTKRDEYIAGIQRLCNKVYKEGSVDYPL